MELFRPVVSDATVKTACGICPMACGMEVVMENGCLTKVRGMREHPYRGFLCPKGRAVAEYIFSPKRLTTPLLRQGSGWKEISWEEAMQTIVDRLESIRAAGDARSLAFAIGMPVLLSGTSTVGVIRRFAHVFGTPNCFSVESICYRCRMLGYITTLGQFFVADPENAACIIVWGSNPDNSSPPLGMMIRESRKKGAKLVVIDPRRTPLAALAEEHLQPLPGTDGALLLAMLNTIITEDLYDRDFIEKYTFGFSELAEHVQKYSPEYAQQLTTVPAEKIRAVARLFALNRPACIIQGTNALDQNASGFQNSRAIAILEAITGNIDIPGGFIQLPRLRVNIVEEVAKVAEKPLGIDSYPLFYGVYGREFGEGQTLVFLETLLTGQPYSIRAMFVCGSNPVVTWPNSQKVERALRNLEFLVVIDQFMTKTARLAHLVLPAGTFLERPELCDYYNLWGFPYVMVRKKIFEYGQCRPDLEFWLELAHRMGFQEYFPWQTIEEIIDYTLAPAGLSYRSLSVDHPEGLYYGQRKYQKYIQKGFKTPTGKIELFSSYLEKMGYPPLPVFVEPPENPGRAPELAAKYPLVLTTGSRHLHYLHSQLRDVPSLSRKTPEPYAEIHPQSARQYGLSNGDLAMVASPRGEIRVRVRVTEEIMPGIVNIPHGWEEANVNILTDNAPVDKVTGYPALKGLLCKIEKL